jgi:nicotinamidase-related amidase
VTVTVLDPKTALIVVDLQKGIVGLPLLHPIDDILKRTRALLDAFRRRNLPVALVNVAGVAPGRTEQPRGGVPRADGWTDLIPELNRQPSDIVVTKHTWGAFPSTNLDSQLKALDVTQVVVVGIATGTGVESTARQAYELGYHVTLAVDAMTDRNSEAHDYSIKKVFPRLGETGTTEEIVNLLSGRV